MGENIKEWKKHSNRFCFFSLVVCDKFLDCSRSNKYMEEARPEDQYNAASGSSTDPMNGSTSGELNLSWEAGTLASCNPWALDQGKLLRYFNRTFATSSEDPIIPCNCFVKLRHDLASQVFTRYAVVISRRLLLARVKSCFKG